jgi:RND family efflux transporter MFP subunit
MLAMMTGLLPALATEEPLVTAEARYVPIQDERHLDGLIEAVNQATVSAQTSGRVIKINYDVDDYVEKGAILLQFRDTEQRAGFDAAQANYEEALSEYRRIKDLYAKKLVARSALDKAEARLKATRAARDQARERLENTRVRAPYSGIVVKRHIEVGEVARVGQKLFTGISLEQLRATTNVPQDIINRVRKFKQARVILDRDSQRSVEAASLTISPYADPVTHTFPVRVNLPKNDYHIYPGMFVKVAFEVGQQRRLVVPRVAVAHRSEVSAVYVVDEQQRVHYRQVRPGRALPDDRIEILAGLNEGEKVALEPVRATQFYKQQHAGASE